MLDSECDCVPPYTSDAFCSGAACYNGGQFDGESCVCPIQWTGTQCQIASGISSPTDDDSSSSSTGSDSSSGISDEEANSNSSLSGGAIAGIAVGAVAGTAGLVGAGVYLSKGALATVKTSIAASRAAAPAAPGVPVAGDEELVNLLPRSL